MSLQDGQGLLDISHLEMYCTRVSRQNVVLKNYPEAVREHVVYPVTHTNYTTGDGGEGGGGPGVPGHHIGEHAGDMWLTLG